MSEIRGMVRIPDAVTSVAAARGLKRETLKSRVMAFAREAGVFGFLDEELFAIDPSRPESSLRKRRTELFQAGWILDAGYDRKNSHGQPSKVWVHREHSLNPPPLGKVEKPKKWTAEDERAAVVKWLESRDGVGSEYLAIAADGIKDGEHL